ncbi:MAG: hypothetical protein LBD59_06360, partial [Prevotellaceae bacterium]|nr:hypothetical protein [Prevotellaceae bacterium]
QVAERKRTAAKQIQHGARTKAVERLQNKHIRFYNTVKALEEIAGEKFIHGNNPHTQLTHIAGKVQAKIEDFEKYTIRPFFKYIAELSAKLPAEGKCCYCRVLPYISTTYRRNS